MYHLKSKRYLVLSIVVFLIMSICIFVFSSYNDRNISNFKLQELEITKIAVLDGEKLKNSAKCFNAHEKIANMISDVINRMNKSQSEIKSEYEKIKNNNKLSQAQKQKDIAKVEAKWTKISSDYNSEMQSIKNKDLQLSNYIQKKLDYVIRSIANANKLSVVLNKGSKYSISVFYISKNTDITDLVIQKLDELLPDVNLKEIESDR